MNWFEKLVKLRECLGYNQKEFAAVLDTSQKELSNCENGKKTFLPNWYLKFLLQKGYNLNIILDVEAPFDFEKITGSTEKPEEEGPLSLKALSKTVTKLEAIVSLNILNGNLSTESSSVHKSMAEIPKGE